MDETSPGTYRPDNVRRCPKTSAKRASTRMDTLLATLQRDIKMLCQQGDLVSQKVLQLYNTFEGVIHHEAADSTKLNEDATEDEDSGVAMATSEFKDVYSPHSTKPGHTAIAVDSEANNRYEVEPAWYEIDDDDNGDDPDGDGSAPRKAARNGLTEEWVKYGHFQLKGKHHEPLSEKTATQTEDESVLYDWESFTEEDDEVTLAYDWETFEENTLSNEDNFQQRVPQDKIFRYSVEDKKVVPNVPRQRVHRAEKGTNYAKENDPYHTSIERVSEKIFSGRAHSGVTNPKPQRHTDCDDVVKSKRRELYRKISSDIVDRLSRQPANQDWKPGKNTTTHCDHRHLVCTCQHKDRVSDVRATSGAHLRREDKNNINSRTTKHKQSRIMTNGSFECRLGNSKRKSREHEYGKSANAKFAHQFDVSHCHVRPTADRRHVAQPHSDQRKLRNSDVQRDKKIRTSDSYFAGSEVKHDGCTYTCGVSNIAGDRRPLFYDIEKALDGNIGDLPECECKDIRKERTNVNFSSYIEDRPHENAINQYMSDQYSDSNTCIGTEESFSEDSRYNPMKRLTWDLADSPLPFDDGPLSRDRTPHLRASYAGPNKRLFPSASCNPVSNFSRCANPTRTTPTSQESLQNSSNHRDSLRLCGIRYAGFQAAWPSINSAGNRRSFSGFTIVDSPKDKTRWGTSQQLQPTYC